MSMEAADILLLNILTGTSVWIAVLLLGINLIGGKYTDMAKSKIVKANEKIAEAVTGGREIQISLPPQSVNCKLYRYYDFCVFVWTASS